MSKFYNSLITGLWAGLTVGISSFILETLKIQSKPMKVIVFSIAVYIVLKIVEKFNNRTKTSYE